MLNSMGGCIKTIQQWQKVWFDRKHLAKKAAADARRSASGTGGGPNMANPLSQWQLKVLCIMGDGFGERQTGARVPAFIETNDPMPSTSRQASQALSFPQPSSEELEPSHEDEGLVEPTNQRQSHTISSQPTRRRRRQPVAGSDVRTRLYQYEEGRREREILRNSELAGIRAALFELCGLLREYLHRN